MPIPRKEGSILRALSPAQFLGSALLLGAVLAAVIAVVMESQKSSQTAQAAQKVSVSCTYTRPAEAPTGTIEMWYVVAEKGERVKKPVCHRDVVSRLTCEREVLDVKSVGLIVEYNYGDERVMHECATENIHGTLTCTADDQPVPVTRATLSDDCHFILGSR